MKHFSIASFNYGESVRFLRCVGDERGLCDKCKARFECFTGEIRYNERYFGGYTDIDENLEMSLFGEALFIIEYDVEAHNYNYNTKLHPAMHLRIKHENS